MKANRRFAERLLALIELEIHDGFPCVCRKTLSFRVDAPVSPDLAFNS